MPVTVPRSAKPSTSIRLREAASAPEIVKTITPNQSRATAAVSKSMGEPPLTAPGPPQPKTAIAWQRLLNAPQLHDDYRGSGEPPVRPAQPGRDRVAGR